METRLMRRSTLEQDLPHAISRAELDLTYQLIVDLPTGRPVGVEAQLCWRHPTLGTVSQDELMPVAEELGLLGELGRWVLHWACRQLSRWLPEHPDLWIAVNARTRQLGDPTFPAVVTMALEAYQVPPSALVVEVSEPDVVAARDGAGGHPGFQDVVDNLGQLRALGVRTAVDNFGTGPTSLSQLRVLPVDLLKVDREVFGPPEAGAAQVSAIMDVMVRLGRQLGIEVIAQGVETAADQETVRVAGCRFGQGTLLGGPPVPPEHLEAALERYRDRPVPGPARRPAGQPRPPGRATRRRPGRATPPAQPLTPVISTPRTM
jgi:EAL domain-containing protein (putative c-di-GMP-specific phosphodiesterase class I)